ncbi:MAG: hypothetical protein ABJD66_02570 [Cellulophaga sp.]|uniref:DUF4375 domain-containing protein n=1 Tax=Algibacter lectus TaxID=221126 RepID=A0A090VJD5_9FLAO|nr:hypothetical protein [Algibacter lectus]GAL64870.1 hypothetical protein JCM19300_2018 [Algibacter lectus]
MNTTFKELLSDTNIDSEDALLEVSDRIFIDKPISQIKEKATKEAFNIFICVQIIGCWKSDGWNIGIFGNFPEIVPYASIALKNIGLNQISDIVLEIIETFPEGTDFSQNNQDYCDVINFLGGHNRFIKDKEKFEKYSEKEIVDIKEKHFNSLEKAEKLVGNLWSYNSPNIEGWGIVIDYLKKNINSKLWKE